MLFSPQQVAHTRDHTLLNLLELSSACFEAGQRFSELLATASRDALHHNSKHFTQFGHGQIDTMTNFPANFWLDSSARHSRLLDSTCEIFGEAHKALIQSAEEQVRVFDKVIFSTLNRVAKATPWEGEIALNTMRTVLESAEQTLHGMSVTAVKTVDIAEQEVHQITESLIDKKTPRKRSTPRTSANKS